MGRKHRGKRNCLLRAISRFSSVFKRLVLQTLKKTGLVWERLKVQNGGKYSITCIRRPLKGRTESGLLQQWSLNVGSTGLI